MNDVQLDRPPIEVVLSDREALNRQAQTLITSVRDAVRVSEEARTQVADAFSRGENTPVYFTIRGANCCYRVATDSRTPLQIGLERWNSENTEQQALVDIHVDPDLANVSGLSQTRKDDWQRLQRVRNPLAHERGIISFMDATHFETTAGIPKNVAEDSAARLTLTPGKRAELAGQFQQQKHFPIADTPVAVQGAQQLITEFVREVSLRHM